MKKTIFILSLVSFGLFSAQDLTPNQVPNAVMTAFNKSYTSPEKVEWEKKNTNYQVEFKNAGLDVELLYSASGKIIASEKDITEANLPKSVKSYFTKNNIAFDYKDLEETKKNGTTTYKVELMNDQKYYFNAKGQLLNTKK